MIPGGNNFTCDNCDAVLTCSHCEKSIQPTLVEEVGQIIHDDWCTENPCREKRGSYYKSTAKAAIEKIREGAEERLLELVGHDFVAIHRTGKGNTELSMTISKREILDAVLGPKEVGE